MNPQVHPTTNPARPYDYLLDAVNEKISLVLSDIVPSQLMKVCAYSMEGGKRIRPLLTMLSCSAVGGGALDALSGAAAIELLHSSSLVHDDIMDGSSLRRGRSTLHTQYDVPTAILAGDTLIALAFRLLHRMQAPRKQKVTHEFTEAFLHTCEGQSYDIHLSSNEGMDVAHHRLMAEKKTAKLLEAATTIGAMIGTPDESMISALREFGLNIGMAYQAQDDLLDVEGDEGVAGKTLGGDVRNGKHTFLKLAYPAADEGRVPSSMSISDVAALVGDLTTTACHALDMLPNTPARECLASLAASLVERRM
jgi:geranylgeranyl pyrophosphate synthase